MSIEKTSTGAWRVRWREGTRDRSKVIGTLRDARVFDAEVTRQKRIGDLATLDSGKRTLQDFATKTWWPTYVRPNVERATRESYAGVWDRHIEAALGGVPLREITAPSCPRSSLTSAPRASVRKRSGVLRPRCSRASAGRSSRA